MKYLLIIVFTLFSKALLACHCSFLGELSKTDLDKTDYVALVKIKEILPVKIDSSTFYGTNFFKIVVEEIVHYKGSHFTEIIVAGGHPKFNSWTSCDFGINENEEWIIYAQLDKGRPFVYPCWRTTKYKQVDGFRDWQYLQGIKDILFLDSFYNKESQEIKHKKGEVKYFYSNGNIEKLENYKKGELHGEINYFFPDGKLYGKGYYFHGVLHKTFLWYYRDGNIEKRTFYNKGLKVDTSIYYSKTTNGVLPYYIYVYNNNGEVTHSQKYTGFGEGRYLWTESIYDAKTKKEKIIYYHENGKPSSVHYRLNKIDFGDYIEYDKDGKIIKQWKYDDDGKIIK